MIKKITTPLTKDKVKSLIAGDIVYISGTIYTARDVAHQRLLKSIEKGEKLPFNIKDSIIYYVGPAPAKPDDVIGSAGPTTSYRMDNLTLPLLKLGLKGMVGKGDRSLNVLEGIKRYECVYFAAVGGAGALIANSIKESEIIAYEDLGAEAIRKLKVENFPVTVVIDSKGNNLYTIERKKYERK
ncbi:fumarate hydratase subunit beta [Tepidibacter formicigenes DSM 15518]|uniref:Fumarate hydratase subunit beta n=1 Tax=Tepidibacter formicigenes DSM 15518 TaxID=1123349 RepID=A0A1M6KY64_9FIRM|nr:Fe-S-containing hydro-lyase [Tepidibacter formicigenes]SHJ63880.1 fumarate hydratase subunit beta [Tepidibacter formicigenes DSM 15518]